MPPPALGHRLEPALPQTVQRVLPPGGLGATLARARAAAVGAGADLGKPLVTDVPTTRLTLATDDEPVWTGACAQDTSAGLDVPVDPGEPNRRSRWVVAMGTAR